MRRNFDLHLFEALLAVGWNDRHALGGIVSVALFSELRDRERRGIRWKIPARLGSISRVNERKRILLYLIVSIVVRCWSVNFFQFTSPVGAASLASFVDDRC